MTDASKRHRPHGDPTDREDGGPAERRHAPLAMSRDEFRAAGHRLVDQLAELLAQIPQGPVTDRKSVV